MEVRSVIGRSIEEGFRGTSRRCVLLLGAGEWAKRVNSSFVRYIRSRSERFVVRLSGVRPFRREVVDARLTLLCFSARAFFFLF